MSYSCARQPVKGVITIIFRRFGCYICLWSKNASTGNPSIFHPEGKALCNFHSLSQMRKYAGQNEVRFKVTDRDIVLYRETAWYLYENHVIDKSNIQSFGRWSMDFVCKCYRPAINHSIMMKEQRQKQMQQPTQLSYPGYYYRDPTQPF
jgi:hypothetical protein